MAARRCCSCARSRNASRIRRGCCWECDNDDQGGRDMTQLKAFISGFLATLIFHQGVLALLHAVGPAPAPFDMAPTGLLHVPRVISLAFWGGVWAVALWPLIRPNASWRYWIAALVLGAI